MDSEEDALLVGTVKDDQIIDDQISGNDLKSDNFSNGNCNIITSPVPSRRSDEPTELSFEKSKSFPFQLISLFRISFVQLFAFVFVTKLNLKNIMEMNDRSIDERSMCVLCLHPVIC